jgi:methyl-accepting chemotaxis protein
VSSGFLGGPIASAFVEVTANTDAAERNIQELINRLRDVDRVARTLSTRVTRAFQEMARGIDQALRSIGTAGNPFLQIAAQAEAAATAAAEASASSASTSTIGHTATPRASSASSSSGNCASSSGGMPALVL